jgi:hypothetical protein
MSAPSRPLARSAHPPRTLALPTRLAGGDLAADLLLLGPVLLLALGLRLVNLGAYSGLFDEGIRAEQLFLMAQGYRPFKDIFAAQGPLLLDAFYPLYALFGSLLDQPLVAVRLVAVSYSLIGLAALYWVGRQLAGRMGGLASALVLGLSPLYLEGSRLALAEVPALAPAILALGCALRYRDRGRPIWLVGAGLLVTLGLLMKPIVFAAAPAVALAALQRGRKGVRDLLLVGVAMLLLSLAVVWLLGIVEVREQILAYRQASREAEGWSLRKNLQALQAGLTFEPAALLPLATLGGLALLASSWRRALPALAWALGSLALLLSYSPLHGKHIVVLIPSVALLAGAGWAGAWQVWSRLAPGNRPAPGALAAAPLALAGLWYSFTLAPLLGQSAQVLRVTADTDVDPAFDQYADAVAVLRALTSPDDFIVTDQPYLAFLAGRKVPPELVDTALARIRSRSLTANRAQALAAAYNPKVVLLWGDRLRGLAAFKGWVDASYQVVKVYNRRNDTDRALYLRRDADFAAARALLGQKAAGGPSADFAGELRLAGMSLDRSELAAGQGATLTMLWEELARSSVDYHVLLELRGPDGRSLDAQEASLSGGGAGTSEWLPGHWLVQSSFVLAERAAPGRYTVTAALYDSRARMTVPIEGQTGVRELVVGDLTVRQ